MAGFITLRSLVRSDCRFEDIMWPRVSILARGLVFLAVGWGLLSLAYSQTPTSAAAGFYRLELLGNSDTRVSLPFTRPAAAAGLVATVTDDVVTVTGAPAWTANQFVYAAGAQTNTYYMLIASGTLEGCGAPIIANGADTVTLRLDGASLAGLQVGDRVLVIPYWTLGSVFPGGAGVHTSPNSFTRRTEVWIPNLTGPGVNLSFTSGYYFLGGDWYQAGRQGITNNAVLSPSTFFVVRHRVATNTTLTVRGAVVECKWALSLRTSPSQKEDNMVALPRPGALTLNASGLIASGAFLPSPSSFSRTDELYTYDNSQQAFNKSTKSIYYYLNGHWLRAGGGATDVGEDLVFTPGTGYIIRKGATSASPLWINPPNY